MSDSPEHSPPRGFPRKTAVLGLLFLFALLMGAGPGLYLVNPSDSGDSALFLGMPVLYFWAVFWFFVEAATVIAYMVWAKEEHP